MAASAATRVMLISRAAELSLKTTFITPQLPLSQHLFIRPLALLPLPSRHRKHSVVGCPVSGVDGGGVPDEFVYTTKSGFGREFSAIASMLKGIEPLDNSIVSKGVSDSAKDSMKQTISTMLGLLPSDQFSVTVTVAKQPLDRLIVSSIVTGYTLWNAEYRISLIRNFDIPFDCSKRPNFTEYSGGNSVVRWENSDHGEGEEDSDRVEGSMEELERTNIQCLGNLSSETLNYIQQLESELAVVKKEIYAKKEENLEMENMQQSHNNLLEYLRSLESQMVIELSRPSSPEVEEIIHQLAQGTLSRFFDDEKASDCTDDLALSSIENSEDMNNELCVSISSSRDYLAKLLFWCMLLGHHLRGLENRLHLSFVGLL